MYNGAVVRSHLGSFDSIEDDSIFSLGKIVLSPRYSQYPDLRHALFAFFYISLSIPKGHIPTVNKGLAISRPQPGCHLPNSLWPGIIVLFPGRFGHNKSRNLVKHFFQCRLEMREEFTVFLFFINISTVTRCQGRPGST